MAKPAPEVNTITITNFSGRLTRIVNGDLNSGFVNFTTSFGYDPFSKPMNLTWSEVASNLDGQSDLILDGKVRYIGENNPVVYMIGSTGNLYKTQINSNTSAQVNSIIAVSSVKNGTTFVKGGSIEFFGNEPQIYVGSDNAVNKINFDGTAEAVVGVSANYFLNAFRPLKQFGGKLIFGNGTSVGAISAGGTVTSSIIGISSTVSIYSELIPPLPNSIRVKDIDVSGDNTQLLIAGTEVPYANIGSGATPDQSYTVPSSSKIFAWNGTDLATTSANTISTSQLVSFKTYLEKNFFFTLDSFGGTLNIGGNKIFTLIGNRPPFPNAVGVNGNFIFWSSVEKEVVSATLTRTVHSLYYYGSLDGENPPGLYRLLRQNAAAVASGQVVNVPFNKLVEIKTEDANASKSSVLQMGLGTHYFSSHEENSSTSILALRYFNVPPKGSGTSQGGVYETQTQLFSKRIGVSQIRVYIEPAVANNAFQLDMIGSDGTILTNGTYTYTFGDITDSLSGSTAVERINFNTNAKTQYALGIRITNTGTKNMTIKKVEIDFSEEGK